MIARAVELQGRDGTAVEPGRLGRFWCRCWFARSTLCVIAARGQQSAVGAEGDMPDGHRVISEHSHFDAGFRIP